MRLYKTKIPSVSARIVERLVSDGDIEAANHEEVRLDVESVLNEYIRLDREITERTKDMLDRRGLSHTHFGRVKRQIAEKQGVGSGEEVVGWISNQILETFMQSPHVEEIFSEDASMRGKLKEILRTAMRMDEEMDKEVRERIKNIKEGTASWDIEYKKMMDKIRRKHGLET